MSPTEYKDLKGLLWSFRKRPKRLKEAEKELLETFFVFSPESALAYRFREDLTQIFEQCTSKSNAADAIQDWCTQVKESGLREYEGFLSTLEHRFDEITNYFLEGWTSGFVEGFNNRVKVIKRRCYRIFNISALFQRIYLDLNGYDVFARD